MVKLLLYIKHKLPFIWAFIEWLNGLLYRLLYHRSQQKAVQSVMEEFTLPGFTFRVIQQSDLPGLEQLIARQAPGRLLYFKPHGFDKPSLLKAYSNPAFLMMGVFEGSHMVGYFFLRFFWNRKCFVGRLIDEPYEGKGIGRMMNNIMYHIGWRMGFRVLSTISKKNSLVMRSHTNNSTMVVLKELEDDYLFVEFVRSRE
ncbi:MAG TPA: hypothetical protein PLP88_05600 [Bacteroidales bacterium]|nr:hypothetical protein [Bacteroidales bacterium]